ncbi:glycosyltransferase family 2 protein [Riemerella anatipestifer]|uniref:Glycosyltransferase n=1 Tax=Riemerella anatipestifer TaxID=34085 RepID=A0AAP6HC02_RIEAN|nr:glycosyltransferase [Riemerella anatipestifer]MCD5968727.1 glycosyltransferase [Riemerella anatipestifer]MCO7355478.1 glycosyltransferase [Riemerella anatipestifer]MCW0508562.1 glycosyltransferase [Riemerella anatipestifer]MCW0516710.1 glycosyltransferase [Riemerella anatipestifer]MDW3556659.1 glycosyltransferase [Riemerella anatipestifer]
MKKLLTLIVPIYNTEEYLPKCLDSLIIRENLMSLLEVLLIIDGSPDNALEIAREYEEKYPQTFRVINKENGGYGSVLKRGIAEGKGKYCKVLDSDDWYDNQSFERFVEQLQTIDTDVVVTDFVKEYVFENRSELFSLPKVKPNKVYDLDKEINNLDEVFVMHRLAYKTEVVRQAQIDFPEKIFYTDTLFASLPLFFAKDLCYIAVPLYRYLIGRDGQTVAPVTIRKNRKGVETVIRYYYQKYTQHKSQMTEEKRKFILSSIKTFFQMYYKILVHLDFSSAKKELAEWHSFVKKTPEYKAFSDIKLVKYYNILPYFIFRYTSFIWRK